MTNEVIIKECIIDASSTDSSIADMEGCALSAVEVPADMDSTALTFKFGTKRDDMKTFRLSDNSADAITITCDGTSRIFNINPQDSAGLQFVQVIAGSTETGERVIRMIGSRALNR